MSFDAIGKSLQDVELNVGAASEDPSVCLGRWLVEVLHTERALVDRVLEQRHRTIVSELEVHLRGVGGLGRVPQETLAGLAQDCGLQTGLQSSFAVVAGGIAAGASTKGQKEEPDCELVQNTSGEVNSDAVYGHQTSSVAHYKSALSFQNFWEESVHAPKRLNANHTFFFGNAANFTSTENWIARLVTSRSFEIGFAVLIVLNTIVSAVQVQYEGLQNDFEVRYTVEVTQWADRLLPADRAWPHAREVLHVLEMIFGVVFTIELALKMASRQRAILCCKWNMFDFLIITAWVLSSCFQVDLLMNPMVLRVCRIARLLRIFKLIKTVQLFDSLHLLIRSIEASLSVLIWSAVLLVFVMLISSLMLNAQLVSYIRNDDQPLSFRQEVFKYFGSFTRSMLTMFEITLGNWVPVCRLLLEHVHEGYAVFFVVYKVVIGFGCVKVISSVFMHETFKVAGADNALMVIQRERTEQEHGEKMRALFHEADSSRDGYLNMQEFETVLRDPWVKTWLAAMELTVQDTSTLFKVLAQEDGRISPAELVSGVAKLKGPARSLDMVTTLKAMDRDHKAEFAELRARLEAVDRQVRERDIHALRANLEAVASDLRPRTPVDGEPEEWSTV